MTFGGFLDGQAGAGRTLSVGPTADFADTVGASFDFTWKAHTTAAAIQYQGAPLNERNTLIKQRFGQDIHDITGTRKKYVNPTAEGHIRMQEEANEQIDGWIERGRAEFPEKYNGIKTTKEIRDEARKTVDISENHMNEIMARNPSALSRMTGGFIGGAGATILDPPNLATLPLGAGPVQGGLKGFAAARAILKAAAIDGVINAGIEATSQPAIMAWQQELGRRYGFGDAVENVAFAFAGGAGLSGLIRGLGRGVNYAGSVSADVLDRIASSERIPASVRNAASFMSRQAHIDESAPPGMIQTGEDLKLHRETAQKVADDFESYATSSATSSGDNLTASSEKTSAGPKDAGTQDLPSSREGLSVSSSSLIRAKTDPSILKANSILGSIDTTSQSMIYHTIKKVDNLLKKATALLPEINAFTEGMSKDIPGLKAYPGRVKTKESLSAKMKKKGRGAETMPDILGGRLVADTPEAISAAVDRLRSSTQVIEIDDKLNRGNGYRAVHVIVATDKGVSVEIQIQPKEIREVQDEAHEKYYKKWDDYQTKNGIDWKKLEEEGRYDEFMADNAASDRLFNDAWELWEARTGGARGDSFADMAPPERINELDLPEGLTPEVSADRVAIAESDMKALVDELGDEAIALDDGRMISVKDFAEEIKAKKAIIDAMNTCRIA